MKAKICPELEAWLDRLPLVEPSEEMKHHLATCRPCQELFDSLAPLATALSEIPSPARLSEEKMRNLVEAARKEALRLADRRTAWRLSRNILIGLPFIAAVHWLWLNLSSKVLAELLSPFAAQIFSVLFLVTSSLAAALLFAAIPFVWAVRRENPRKELTP
ncbi:MAG: hypothetical protein QHH14_14240 [Clostridiales bacterium]|nr:hypothetical protein [Clostridiales bacterium]